MALVRPLEEEEFDTKLLEEVQFFKGPLGYLNRWNDSMGTTLEELPVQVAKEHLAGNGWEIGKHEQG